MKKILDFVFSQRWFLFGLLLSAFLLWPLFFAPFFYMQDDEQLIRVHQMSVCLADLQIPCRWVPDLGAGMGYPMFNFYGPLAYYAGGILFLITGNLLFSTKSIYGIAFLGSYIFMFLAGRKVWGNTGGFLSGVLYSFLPYHALNFYVRGAMGEMWGMLFFPAVLWGVLRLKDKASVLNTSLLSLFFSLLIISHNLSALLFFPVMIGLLALQFRFVAAKKIYLISALTSVLVGLLLAAFYWLPAVSEKELTWVETTTVGYFSYTEHFKGLRKLFVDTSWEYGNSVREVPGGERDSMSYQIGWMHLLIVMISLAAIYFNRKKHKFELLLCAFFVLVVIGSVFMIHPRSQFVWDLLRDQLKYVQFPWRFLLLISVGVSILGGGSTVLFERNNRKYLNIFTLCLVLGIVFVNTKYFQPIRYFNYSQEEWLSGDLWKIQQRKAILDYLPKTAQEAPAAVSTKDYEILTGNTQIKDYKKGSDWFSLNADVSSHTILRISIYDFPEWKVFMDGAPIKIDNKNNLGLITLLLGEGQHSIYGKLYNSPVRTLGNFLSVLGGFILLGMFLMGIKSARRWVLYYVKGMK